MSDKFTDVMLDMETFGLSPRAVVISLALVAFDPKAERVGPFIYRFLDREQQAELKRETDEETVRWWAQQPDEVRAQLDVPGESLFSALQAVRYFIEDRTTGPETVRLWSCGADFDCVLLGTLHRDVGMKPPWRYFNQRCYRTLKEMFRPEYAAACQELPRTGKHDALQDAIWQAKVAQYIYRAGPR